MRKITLLIAFMMLGFIWGLQATAQLWSLDFESTGGYTTSVPEFTDGFNDFWLRTDGSNISSSVVYNGPIGNYYFAGMDLDGSPGTTSHTYLNIDDITITDQTNLEFRIYLAEDDASDGNQDWDGADFFHIGYDIDNTGTFTPLIWVESSVTGSNGFPLIDTDFDGLGDGTEITSTFVQFTASIPITGDLLDIQLEFQLNSGDEDIALDQLEIYAAGGNSLPAITNIVQTPSSDILSTNTVSVSADIADIDGTIGLAELHWGTTSGSLGNTINMSNISGDTYTTDTDIPAQADGTTVYYEVYAEDDVFDGSTSSEYNYTVTDPATTTLPYAESFDVDLGACYTYSVAGVNTWYYYSGGQLANCNGYNGSNPEEDWLVLPGINLDGYSNEIMNFTTSAKYGVNDPNNYLKLMYSSDYAGLGDPTAATWTELSYNQPAGINNSTEVSAFSGNVDLSGITGTNVYIAFKYYSTNSPTRWGVDDIVIAETLSWYNLQWPGTPAPQPSWWNLTVYAQCWQPGVTDAAGQGAGIECWIGYSTVDENPDGSANFIWVMANYDSDQGSNDQYSTNLGADIPMAPGTYYYVARWRFNNGPFTYGGFNSGAWDGTTNVSGVLTITPSAATSTWTGNVNDNWFDGGNWDNDVPGYNTDATIPVGLTNYPLTTAGTAMCNNLLVQSDATGDASLIEYGNLNVLGTATVERNMAADVYHSYSPSVSGLTSGLFHLPASTDLDVYLYSHNELNNGDANGGYFEITDLATPLMSMAGYAVYLDGLNAVPPVSDWTFEQVGPLNSGSFGAADNLTRTGAGAYAGFNYVGNPYPSFIDWDAVTGWTKTNMNGTVYSENNGNWATWVAPGPGANGGSNIIAPGQGFFVEVNNAFATGTIMMDNTVRTNTSTPYLKSSVANYVKLSATGNDKTDEMVVRFDENATTLFDGQFDGVKLAAGDNSYPQIYSIADRNLAYNALPETDLVQLGFSAGVDGEYSIQLVDVDNIPSVWLEDTFTGIHTDLTAEAYTFNYSTSDDASRFILHFAPLGVTENASSLFNIFAFGDEVIVSTTALQSDAQIFVYNMMGQEVATAQMTENVSKLKMNNSSIYLVKVVSQQGMVSKKVSTK